jgi:hypothetical protein
MQYDVIIVMHCDGMCLSESYGYPGNQHQQLRVAPPRAHIDDSQLCNTLNKRFETHTQRRSRSILQAVHTSLQGLSHCWVGKVKEYQVGIKWDQTSYLTDLSSQVSTSLLRSIHIIHT